MMLLFIFLLGLYVLYIAGAAYANLSDETWIEDIKEAKGKYKVMAILTLVMTAIVNFIILFFVVPIAKGMNDYENL